MPRDAAKALAKLFLLVVKEKQPCPICGPICIFDLRSNTQMMANLAKELLQNQGRSRRKRAKDSSDDEFSIELNISRSDLEGVKECLVNLGNDETAVGWKVMEEMERRFSKERERYEKAMEKMQHDVAAVEEKLRNRETLGITALLVLAIVFPWLALLILALLGIKHFQKYSANTSTSRACCTCALGYACCEKHDNELLFELSKNIMSCHQMTDIGTFLSLKAKTVGTIQWNYRHCINRAAYEMFRIWNEETDGLRQNSKGLIELKYALEKSGNRIYITQVIDEHFGLRSKTSCKKHEDELLLTLSQKIDNVDQMTAIGNGLGLKAETIRTIQNDNNSIESAALIMLRKWYNSTNGLKQDTDGLNQLKHALQKSTNNILIAEVIDRHFKEICNHQGSASRT